ncbi:MAG: haloalkane dehalogenase [Gammaproteobacteria bacterium]|nr:haloalkane dehalogenase [Gammaproteobacteria bacterium]
MRLLLSKLALLLCLLPSIVLAQEVRPGVLRTPDARFENLPGYDFEPHYLTIDGYRIHYIDEGPADGEVILMLHGEPSWSYLYRKMLPLFAAAGYRAIAPDLIGFGRSDKPVSMDVHTYQFHVNTQTALVEALNLTDVTFVGQDWGGLIGLRVVAENEQRFARVAIANTGLPDPQVEEIAEESAFMNWKRTNQRMIDAGDIPTGDMISSSVGDPAVKVAYDAPFPDPSYKAGPLIMPQRVPVDSSYPGVEENAAAWEVFKRWNKPFLTSFSDGDRITAAWRSRFLEEVPGAQNQPHTTIQGAGHFLQEQKGEEWARLIIEFIDANPI